MDDSAPTTSPDNDWCSINEAARRLGVTATAIRNRLKRGTLETRPNGNFGRLVRVPRPITLPVPEPVTLTPEERVTLTMTVTVLADHVATLKEALAKSEAATERERERADNALHAMRLAEAEAVNVPALRAALEAVRDERDHLLTREHLRSQRRWYRRLVGG